jgi:Domain of unknown function (DUF4276)
VTQRIAIIVEGATEKAFKPALQAYLDRKLTGVMPKLTFISKDGRLPTQERLKRDVQLLLQRHDAVVALTDVYTGRRPFDFLDAADAKQKMRQWVGQEPRFYPHAAQYEVEAWLLPYWSRIQKISGSNRTTPSSSPEAVNHDRPPAKHLEEVFRTGLNKRAYSKTRDAADILRGQDLELSAARCPELRAFLDTILALSEAP